MSNDLDGLTKLDILERLKELGSKLEIVKLYKEGKLLPQDDTGDIEERLLTIAEPEKLRH